MIDLDAMRKMLVGGGMTPSMARVAANNLSDDLSFFEADAATAGWALSHGFFPGRVKLYGLNESNYGDFMPDYAYYMMHPINGWQRLWVNDKLTLKYVLDCEGCREFMPRYFLYVQNDGRFSYLMDAPYGIPHDRFFLLRLLEREGALAMKPNNGSGGIGFMKVELSEKGFLVNNEPRDGEFMDALVRRIKNYVVTSYVRQHPSLAAVWPEAECTLRIVMTKVPSSDPCAEAKWSCAWAFARFGLSVSGGASNLSSGGVGVDFDFTTGRLGRTGYRYMKFCEEGHCACDRHPDTGVPWEGIELPNWDYAKKLINRVCKRLGSLDYLGFDIVITDEGAQLLEINTHPSCDYANLICGPVLANGETRRFFESKGLSKFLDAGAFRDSFLACCE